ncbi:TOPRIM nucleotidyl transferase/hydrolase domain-containing protein [Paractinoplanes rishiriensis]|uniref:OLD protein-like TOPRIM domain-containing protein n=1 Tax=Paractinoplanes rishiriensis TaxID=1050105 RepID=A0A919MZT2_9ACTN|nr:ATP-dependent endonuclease [Actinoplanes rishiriensis]GIE94207.1 hypothetical protein Ari01nite_16720 [Actinoplanes rishiriensis]
MAGGNAASMRATADALAQVGAASAVVLVEGISDRIALETAAARHGRDLAAERVVVVPIGGAHAIGRFLAMVGAEVRLSGMCDLREEEIFRRELARAGVGAARDRAEMAALGFFVCVGDLEEELIRAVGPARIEALFEAQGDQRPWRSFRKQVAWRGRDLDAQMYRFIRSSSSRNLRYVRLLVEAADPLPRPLDGLLQAAGAKSSG